MTSLGDLARCLTKWSIALLAVLITNSFCLCQNASVSAMSAHSKNALVWLAPKFDESNSLGIIHHPVAGNLYTIQVEPIQGKFQCSRNAGSSQSDSIRFECVSGKNTVAIHASVEVRKSVLLIRLAADKPLVDHLIIAPFSRSATHQPINIPYLTSPVILWRPDNLFTYVQIDWRNSSASAIHDSEVYYRPMTNGDRHALKEEIAIYESKSIDEVLPQIANPASPYRSEMSGRTILDIWDNNFERIMKRFQPLKEYGIGKCAGIIHNWQSLGYDNGLPMHMPANPASGGNAGLQKAIRAGKDSGCIMSVHENYTDYYQNYPEYAPDDIALKSDGSKIMAWYNKTTKQQSFAEKPSRMLEYAGRESPLIHSRLGTNASYLDVNSAVELAFHVDMDVRTPGAGMSSYPIQKSVELWTYLRRTHQGPALGEGGRHWYYSGLLDGVEAQLGAGGTPSNQDASLPLLVDFDLLRIHPLQVNHGMGYYERWTHDKSHVLDARQHDAYRMQEIAFGHAPFLGERDLDDLPQALIESHLISPVAEAYGTAKAVGIQYGDGAHWIFSSAAVLKNRLSQVHVRYENGLNVVANSGSSVLKWRRWSIPQYGWVATGAHLLAYTAYCGTALCDYAETPNTIFANARYLPEDAAGPGGVGKHVSSLESLSGDRIHDSANIADFGILRTNGMVWLQHTNGKWTLHTYPRDVSFTVALNVKRFPVPKDIQTDIQNSTSIHPIARNGYWYIPLNGASSYSW
ncbi:MAG: DUF5696 domain-containing protein [Terracidiphilus sp.]|nr:DUF5696 domain-containing protein [Terracidiphilus sp.]